MHRTHKLAHRHRRFDRVSNFLDKRCTKHTRILRKMVKMWLKLFGFLSLFFFFLHLILYTCKLVNTAKTTEREREEKRHKFDSSCEHSRSCCCCCCFVRSFAFHFPSPIRLVSFAVALLFISFCWKTFLRRWKPERQWWRLKVSLEHSIIMRIWTLVQKMRSNLKSHFDTRNYEKATLVSQRQW